MQTDYALDYRQLSTVLAALRFWQREAVGVQDEFPEDEIAMRGGTIDALTATEIDTLCELLNLQVAVDFPEFSGHPELDPDAAATPDAATTREPTTMPEPTLDLSRAEKRMMLDLSTAHLSDAATEYLNRPPAQRPGDVPHDNGVYEHPMFDRGGRHHRWLSTGGNSIIVYPHQYGWFVYAHDELGGEDAEDVPAELWVIILAANKSGFAWLNFDCDTSVTDELPVYEEA